MSINCPGQLQVLHLPQIWIGCKEVRCRVRKVIGHTFISERVGKMISEGSYPLGFDQNMVTILKTIESS